MKKKIAVILGDGIGPEVTEQSMKVLNIIAKQFKHEFSYEHALMGAIAIDKTGNPLPDETIKICLASDAILFGAIGDPKYDNDPTAKVRPEQGLLKLRKELQLFANIRPVKTYETLHHLSPLKPRILENVDFIIFRELTGGIYFGQKIAGEYKDVTVDYLFVDNAAMQIILNPAQFDVILTENLFGDIISDEASVLAGSLGMLPSSSVGNTVALFEPIHGSYPQAKGKDIANPMGSILSAAMLLEHLAMQKEASIVRAAVDWCLSNKFVSKDIDPVNSYSTSAIGDLICEYIEKQVTGEGHVHHERLHKSTII